MIRYGRPGVVKCKGVAVAGTLIKLHFSLVTLGNVTGGDIRDRLASDGKRVEGCSSGKEQDIAATRRINCQMPVSRQCDNGELQPSCEVGCNDIATSVV